VSGVTVAIPVRNGGELLARVLDALSRQSVEHELLVCDSGSSDGSLELVRSRGARVVEIAPESFSHGATRNLLMAEAGGERVALLSQDAEPADDQWLAKLLGGFDLAPDVAAVYGPYRPRPDASLAVRLELEGWFRSLSPDGEPRVDRLSEDERALAPGALVGRRGFLTDANVCLLRSAWQQVPFRGVECAEDRALALDLMRAGYAKAYVPAAAVVHSHAYTTLEQLRRSFDEWRGLLEVYGWREPASPRQIARQMRGAIGEARRSLALDGAGSVRRWTELGRVATYHGARLAGAVLGSRADHLPASLRRRLSLERRAGFASVGAHDPHTDSALQGSAL
jgi:glycosyltransferase involved in cell wall biosynthesis